jgi:hypothetical protein
VGAERVERIGTEMKVLSASLGRDIRQESSEVSETSVGW